MFVVTRKTDGFAIASLVLGILAIPGAFFLGAGLAPAVLAIVLGLIARDRIKRSGGTLAGSGLATAGWILGGCGIVLVVAYAAAVLWSFRSIG